MKFVNYQELSPSLKTFKETLLDAKKDGFSNVYVHTTNRTYGNQSRSIYLVHPITKRCIKLEMAMISN